MVSFKASSIATFLVAASQYANAAPLAQSSDSQTCNADNALRNFRSSQHLPDTLPFCSQFLGLPAVTVTATAPSTVTATVSSLITSYVTSSATSAYFDPFTLLQNLDILKKRAISTPAFIATERYPASRISSACNCLTIPLSTSTSYATSGTVTVTQTATIPVATATETSTITYIAGSNGVNKAPFNLDDAYYAIQLPFSISAYGYASSSIRVSLNGLIWLNPYSTGDYQQFYTDDKGTNLPQPGTQLPDISVLPFWSDLFISERSDNFMAYTISGTAPNRKVTFEWSVGSYAQKRDDYHFTATFSENQPDIFTYHFISIPTSTLGTVAAQSYTEEKVLLYSRFEGKVHAGLTLVFDTVADTITEV